jgi:hypothetical protein
MAEFESSKPPFSLPSVTFRGLSRSSLRAVALVERPRLCFWVFQQVQFLQVLSPRQGLTFLQVLSPLQGFSLPWVTEGVRISKLGF